MKKNEILELKNKEALKKSRIIILEKKYQNYF